MNCPKPDEFAKINCGITPSSFSTEWMRDIELLVPLYQRLFVWEEEQINQLLEDLEHAYHASTPYFIGTLTVFTSDHEQPNTWELVDGQQRITFLTLLGAACSHRQNQDSLWEPFIVKGDGMISRIRYFARDYDQKDLRKIWTEGFDANGGITNPNFRRFNVSVLNLTPYPGRRGLLGSGHVVYKITPETGT